MTYTDPSFPDDDLLALYAIATTGHQQARVLALAIAARTDEFHPSGSMHGRMTDAANAANMAASALAEASTHVVTVLGAIVSTEPITSPLDLDAYTDAGRHRTQEVAEPVAVAQHATDVFDAELVDEPDPGPTTAELDAFARADEAEVDLGDPYAVMGQSYLPRGNPHAYTAPPRTYVPGHVHAPLLGR
ncbi:hypothetical protein [Tomitella biformata]|uniref:hypothetical protein n=1 Tax=Tomitella biformata TaxID=630403 RepID=UPI000467D274|nr:hypothetical protein [Tomitella biformata]